MSKIISCEVCVDEYTDYISKSFDYTFDGTSYFECHDVPNIPEEYSIGVIFGSSGSGKSNLLKSFGSFDEIIWDDKKSVASHFDNPKEAVNKLTACGLNSIPSICKPYHVLSTGEKFRADTARRIKSGCVIDEFTSVVNRDVAKSASVAISKYIKSNGLKNVVLATCHEDVIDWLCPDWTYNTDTKELSVRGYLRRPSISIKLYRCSNSWWEMFKNHHYLSGKMNPACLCFLGLWDNMPVAFNASIPMPSKIPPLYPGDNRKKYRESRTVVLPDFQGMGIGTRFSNAIGEIFLANNYRYFSKTAHIRMGEYRQNSSLWRPTSTNLKSREKSQKCSKKQAWHHMMLDTKRICYSHEYIGEAKEDEQ